MSAVFKSNMFQKISPATLFQMNKGKSNAISTPLIDFVFVGGISFLFIPLIFFQELGVPYKVAMGMFYLSFVINYPHFMHSYQLLYKGFFKVLMSKETTLIRKLRFILAGVVAPLVLIEFLLIGILQEDHKLLGYGTNLMFFLVGWHYVKQGYGILMVLSVRQKIYYKEIEKKILLFNAYACWITFWSLSNRYMYEQKYYEVPWHSFVVPSYLITIGIALSVFLSLVSAYLLGRKDWAEKQICMNGLIAYGCGIYVWLKLVHVHPIFMYFAPALHSLQYLLFVWKMQYEKSKDSQSSAVGNVDEVKMARNMRNFVLIAIIMGAASFYFIPTALDKIVPYNHELIGSQAFIYAFIIFINVHHYFIDFAIWRKDNPDMKYLFR